MKRNTKIIYIKLLTNTNLILFTTLNKHLFIILKSNVNVHRYGRFSVSTFKNNFIGKPCMVQNSFLTTKKMIYNTDRHGQSFFYKIEKLSALFKNHSIKSHFLKHRYRYTVERDLINVSIVTRHSQLQVFFVLTFDNIQARSLLRY